jgi:CRISPR-associated protein (TIGR02584 family)
MLRSLSETANAAMSALPDPAWPASYPRRVVLASLGLAPQVLTETLYCLGTAAPPFVPTEVHIVTTEEGRHRAQLTLLDDSTAMLAALAADYNLNGLSGALKPEGIHVINDPGGNALSDIDCEEHNSAAADLMVELVRAFTGDASCALHVSIAGGRKTMGFLLGYALSLFGRAQDRLSHVLVAEPFQAHPQFFFPPRTPRVLHDRDKRPVSTADAKVTLAEIPVVRLREGLPRGLLAKRQSYSDVVAAAQRTLAHPQLVVDFFTRSLVCGGKQVRLSPMTFAFAAWLAERAMRLGPEEAAVHWSRCDWREFLAVYTALPNQSGERIASTRARLAGEGAEDFFREQVSRMRAALQDTLGAGSVPYEPRRYGRKPMTRVGFGLPAAAISVAGQRTETSGS